MNVISIKSTKKLVNGATYRVASLNNLNTKGYSFFNPIVRIYLNDNSIQSFPLAAFKPEIGDVFPNINWICPEYQNILNEKDQMKIDKNLKAGDYVVPIHDSLKTLVRGRKYKVKQVNLNEHKNSSGYVSWTDIKIQLEGSSRWYVSWNFRKCTNQEVRELSLKSLFDEKTDTETVGRFKRKFDYLSDEEKVQKLILLSLESTIDRNRNQMDIIDWAIEKTGVKYGLKREDFDLVNDIPLSRIFEIIK